MRGRTKGRERGWASRRVRVDLNSQFLRRGRRGRLCFRFGGGEDSGEDGDIRGGGVAREEAEDVGVGRVALGLDMDTGGVVFLGSLILERDDESALQAGGLGRSREGLDGGPSAPPLPAYLGIAANDLSPTLFIDGPARVHHSSYSIVFRQIEEHHPSRFTSIRICYRRAKRFKQPIRLHSPRQIRQLQVHRLRRHPQEIQRLRHQLLLRP